MASGGMDAPGHVIQNIKQLINAGEREKRVKYRLSS